MFIGRYRHNSGAHARSSPTFPPSRFTLITSLSALLDTLLLFFVVSASSDLPNLMIKQKDQFFKVLLFSAHNQYILLFYFTMEEPLMTIKKITYADRLESISSILCILSSLLSKLLVLLHATAIALRDTVIKVYDWS